MGSDGDEGGAGQQKRRDTAPQCLGADAGL